MPKHLKGVTIVKGYAYGNALVFSSQEKVIEKNSIPVSQIQTEFLKFNKIKLKLHDNLKQLSTHSEQSIKKEVEELLVSHSLIIDDPVIANDIHIYIKKNLCNIEYAIDQVFKKLIFKFEKMEDDYLSQRSYDLENIRKKLIEMGRKPAVQVKIKAGTILIAKDILPTDFIELDFKHVLGVVLEKGGTSSHAAIIARNLNIPTITQVGQAVNRIKTGHPVILDSFIQEVIIHPSEKMVKGYKEKISNFQKLTKKNNSQFAAKVKTLDGRKVGIQINVESLKSIENIANKKNPIEIGLYRTEYLFLAAESQVKEEDQFKVYKKVVQKTKGAGVNFRTIDIGGDKLPKGGSQSTMINSPLGYRAIRYSLKNPDAFRNQLRAILRASAFGKTRIMLPMVSMREELEDSLRHIEKAKLELKKKKIAFDKQIEVGIMVEVPSVIFVLEDFMDRLDYVSIGTNDLVQYTLAVDRNNPHVSHLYQPLHKSVLQLIRKTVQIAHQFGKKVSLCGELAGDPFYTPVLIGLQIDSLSMSPYSVGAVKKIVSRISNSEAMALVHRLEEQSFCKKAHRLLKHFCLSRFKDLIKSQELIIK